MPQIRLLMSALLAAISLRGFACEQEVVYSEHLNVDSAGNYYLVEIKRAHGDNLVGTVERSFGSGLSRGQTVSIQFVQSELADAVCAMEFAVGQTYLLRARLRGGALQISRYNSHNIAEDHERFGTSVRDIESALSVSAGGD